MPQQKAVNYQCNHLLLEQPCQLSLNLCIQKVMFKHFIDVSLCNGCSEVLIVTWHDHLHQILVCHPLVVIRVKVSDDIMRISFSCLLNSVIPTQ